MASFVHQMGQVCYFSLGPMSGFVVASSGHSRLSCSRCPNVAE